MITKEMKEKNIFKEDIYNQTIKIMGRVIEIRDFTKTKKISAYKKDYSNYEDKQSLEKYYQEYFSKNDEVTLKEISKEGDGYIVKDTNKLLSPEELKKVKLIKNLKDSVRRTEKTIYELANCNPNLNIFFTLTYAKKLEDREKLLKDFNLFVKAIKYNKQKDFKYIAIFEKHKKGTHKGGYHVHMMCNLDDAQHLGLGELYYEQGKAKRKKTIEQMEIEQVYGTGKGHKGIWKHGFVDIRKPSSKDNDGQCSDVGSYLCKYMSKDIKEVVERIEEIENSDIEEEEKNKLINSVKKNKRYLCSKGLNRGFDLRLSDFDTIQKINNLIVDNSILDFSNDYKCVYDDSEIYFNKYVVKQEKVEYLKELIETIYENGKYNIEVEKVKLEVTEVEEKEIQVQEFTEEEKLLITEAYKELNKTETLSSEEKRVFKDYIKNSYLENRYSETLIIA